MSSQNKEATRGSVARVAVIGMGDMGQTHAEVYRRNEQAELVAVVDNRPGAAAEYAAEHGVPHSFTSHNALLAAVGAGQLKLDGVSICVPNSLHAPIAIAALEAGVHTMCEKPAADTLEAADGMARASRASKAEIMVGYLYRHHPAMVEWIERAHAELGDLLLGEISVMRRDGRPDRMAFLNRALTGGGPGVDLLPHVLAVLADVIGYARPTWVAGTTAPERERISDEVENLAFGTFGFGYGGDRVAVSAQLWVKTSWVAHLPEDEPDERWTMTLTGTAGALKVELPIGEAPAQAGYDAELGCFVERILGIQPWGDDMDHAIWVQQLIEGLYESASLRGTPLARS